MKDDIILLSTAEWDNPFWTNKQHVALELARRGHRVFYIDSIGLRKLSGSSQDIHRVFRRLRAAVSPPRRVHENILVWSPLVLPMQKHAVVRMFNRMVMRAWLSLWLRVFGIKKQILWTYYPLTTEILSTTPFEKTVYHCVDEIKAQPGMPKDVIDIAEHRLLERADIVFTTSVKLYESRRQHNRNTYYLPNVADYRHFSRAMDPALSCPEDMIDIPAPRIGFIGAISGYKIDFRLIREIAEKRPAWSIVMIGKVGEGDPWTDVGVLEGIPNIHLLGPRPYSELPSYLKTFDVAILPNRINEYTNSMFPMKFFEYLSAGKPVVSVDLPALRQFSELVYLARTYDEFIEFVEKTLGGKSAPLEKRLSLARQHTYETRTEKMMQLLCDTESRAGSWV